MQSINMQCLDLILTFYPLACSFLTVSLPGLYRQSISAESDHFGGFKGSEVTYFREMIYSFTFSFSLQLHFFQGEDVSKPQHYASMNSG